MSKHKQITFDRFVRGFLIVLMVVGILLLLHRLSGVLLPFFMAWLIAYILFPLVKFFQYKCRLRYRIVGILLAFLVSGLILTVAFWLIVPPMISEGMQVKDLLMEYLHNKMTLSNIPQQIQQWIQEHLNSTQVESILTHEGFVTSVKEVVPKLWSVVTQSFGLLTSLLSLTMVVLYTLFILLDYEKISKGWVNLLPNSWRPFCVQLVSDVEEGMNKYFRGQACVAFCVGVLFSIGFLIIGFPMAIPLGMFIGLLNMVPYLQTLGFIPTILLAIVKAAETGQNFWGILLLALIVFAVVQTIQDTFLVPKIMGKVTGLNSAIILLSLSIWGSLLGMLGMIIALPLTTLLLNYYQKYVVRNTTDIVPVLSPPIPPNDYEEGEATNAETNKPADP